MVAARRLSGVTVLKPTSYDRIGDGYASTRRAEPSLVDLASRFNGTASHDCRRRRADRPDGVVV